MYFDLGQVELKNGERVQVAAVLAPDDKWSGRLQHLLGHKGEAWRHQIRELLRPEAQGQGVETFFYILHREGAAFSNIMTVEKSGVGVLGHVFTQPEERQKGAASHLMGAALKHFRQRGGRALYLSTGFNSSAFRIYASHGFESVEPGSGVMSFTTVPKARFEEEYFAPGEASIVPLSWAGWATASALFTGSFEGVVRNVQFKLLGRKLTEDPLLQAVEDEHQRLEAGESPQTLALQKPDGAVVGLASWGWHPLWPSACLIDVYCHPNFWNRAPQLLQELKIPASQRLIAYDDLPKSPKARSLQEAGFERVATLPQWITADYLQTQPRDVVVWSKVPATAP